MQTNTTITTTDATNTTNETKLTPTLGELIAAYRAEKEREAMNAALDAAQINADKFEEFQWRLANRLPADLFAALNLAFRWNGDPFARYGGFPEAAFTFGGGEWTIHYDGSREWTITGTGNIYRSYIYSNSLADDLMNALIDYEQIAPDPATQSAAASESQPSADYPDTVSEEIPF